MTSTPSCLPPARTRLVMLQLDLSEVIPTSSDVIFHSFTEILRAASVSKIESSIVGCAITLPPVKLLSEEQQIAAYLKSSDCSTQLPSLCLIADPIGLPSRRSEHGSECGDEI